MTAKKSVAKSTKKPASKGEPRQSVITAPVAFSDVEAAPASRPEPEPDDDEDDDDDDEGNGEYINLSDCPVKFFSFNWHGYAVFLATRASQACDGEVEGEAPFWLVDVGMSFCSPNDRWSPAQGATDSLARLEGNDVCADGSLRAIVIRVPYGKSVTKSFKDTIKETAVDVKHRVSWREVGVPDAILQALKKHKE